FTIAINSHLHILLSNRHGAGRSFMSRNFAEMFAQRDLRASPVIAVQTVMAMRIATLYVRSGRDPLPDMAVRLRSMRAAQALQALTASLARLWPEPFQARRPCCMAMSPDEAVI